jgi:hypothetical protein
MPASLNASSSKSDSRQTNTLAGIQANGNVKVTVEGDTTLVGGQIASVGGGTTDLTTKSLTATNLQDYSHSSSTSFSISGIDKGLGLPGAFPNGPNGGATPPTGGGYRSPFFGNLSFGTTSAIKEGITFSVVGAGTIKLNGANADQSVIATLKRDPGCSTGSACTGRQIVTVDTHDGFSIDIPLIDFDQLGKEATNIANFATALTATVPDNVASQGKESEDYYRRMLARGMSDNNATKALNNPDIQALVATQ